MRSRIGKSFHARGQEFITCQEVITFLLDYLSHELAPDEETSFAAHLSICPSCVAYLQSYEQAVLLGRETLRRELEADPPQLDGELVRAIVQARG